MIDAHHHVWDLRVRDQPWLEADSPIRRSFIVDDLRPLADAAGVVATVMVQTITVADETPEMLAAVDPLVAGVVGWTDVTSPAIADTLASLRALPGGSRLVGIRHQVQDEPDPSWMRRDDVLRGLRAIASAGLAYDVVVKPHQLAAAAFAAGAVPAGVFVLDHAGKPPIASGALEPWATDLRAFAAHPNTVCKLSGLFTEAEPGASLQPYVDAILDAFGPQRIMFGSDWPVSLLVLDYVDVVTRTRELVADLSPAEQDSIFTTTAERTYHLPKPHVDPGVS